ncbi:MAG: hypothetical protein J6T99_07740 [Oscillospiraceae bacterium]|nr:hypothetical protein [Oscillospiraceae bacterium]
MARKLICVKADCFQNMCGISCRLLHSPVEGKECPFYKTEEQASDDRRKAYLSLKERGMENLIEFYGTPSC